MAKKIDKLRKELNFNKKLRNKDNRVDFSNDTIEKKLSRKSWDADLPKKIEEKNNFANKLLILSMAFFVLALTASFFLLRGNVVSGANIEINLESELNIVSGKKVTLDFEIINRNNTNIEYANFSLLFPRGSRLVVNGNETDKVTVRKSLGMLKPGDRQNHSVDVLFFGIEGEDKIVESSIEYRLSGSNAEFKKEENFEFLIDDSPLSVTVDIPDEIVPGNEIPIEVNIISNSTETLKDVALSAEYPSGFTVQRVSKRGLQSNTLWSLGDIVPNQTVKLNIYGVLQSQTAGGRTFRFTTGILDSRKSRITSVIDVNEKLVTISKPFLDVVLSLEGETASPHIADRGENIRGTIAWANRSNNVIRNVELELRFDGAAVDLFSVDSRRGFYDDKERKITWSRDTYSQFAELAPGSQGSTSFSFATHSIGNLRNSSSSQKILLNINIKGEQVGGAISNVTETISKEVLLKTDLSIVANASYTTGRFTTYGPIPPKIGTKTTYNIKIDVNNSGNTLRDSIVTMRVPSYVSLESGFYPDNENVTFDDRTDEITWRIGEIGSVSSRGSRSIEFQVGIIPTIQHLNQSPTLLDRIRINTFDLFVGQRIDKSTGQLTTDINDTNLNVRRPGFVVE